MPTAIAYVENSNEVLLLGLRHTDGDFLNDAHVVLTAVRDGAGVAVETGLPRIMKYVDGSNGDYVAGISRMCAFTNGGKYIAFIDVDASDTDTERYGHWEFPFVAQTRKK